MRASGRFYKVVIPRCAGLEDSYVHPHHPNILGEAMARIFLAGIRVNCPASPTLFQLLVSYRPLDQTGDDLKAARFLQNTDN